MTNDPNERNSLSEVQHAPRQAPRLAPLSKAEAVDSLLRRVVGSVAVATMAYAFYPKNGVAEIDAKVLFGFALSSYFLYKTVFFLTDVLRALLVLFFLGRSCCRLGWHRWKGVQLGSHIGLTSYQITYLVWNERMVCVCLDCKRIGPDGAEAVYADYKSGRFRQVKRGFFSSPDYVYDSPEGVSASIRK